MTRDQQLLVKRALDVAIAASGLLATAPLMGGIAVAIRLTMGVPVLFRQQRPGLHGASFSVLKFRTMSNARAPDGKLESDAARLTPLGRALRATSLDELPQLINVLKGEMSLVGPRPLLVQYLARYSERQRKRHLVKPGITGLAQVRGRNTLSWEEKFEYDVQYVEEWSLGLDLKILLETALSVIRREGISAGDHVTMPEFLGSS